MGCNGSGWGGSGCLWIILIVLLLSCGMGNNGCGCNNCRCNNCGCGNGNVAGVSTDNGCDCCC